MTSTVNFLAERPTLMMLVVLASIVAVGAMEVPS